VTDTKPYQQTIQCVREALQTSFDTLDSYFDLAPTLRAYTPKEGEWCIDEILEHITLTSHYLMLVIKNSRDKVLKRAQIQAITPGGATWSRLSVLATLMHFPGYARNTWNRHGQSQWWKSD
jgi:hypothetical protein